MCEGWLAMSAGKRSHAFLSSLFLSLEEGLMDG